MYETVEEALREADKKEEEQQQQKLEQDDIACEDEDQVGKEEEEEQQQQMPSGNRRANRLRSRLVHCSHLSNRQSNAYCYLSMCVTS